MIFDESNPPRAVGVEYMPNQDAQPGVSLSKQVQYVIKARRLMVVTAGALGTPQILERSGVGNPEILKKLNIPVVSNVPGVGENYQDHHLLLYPYKSSLAPEETLDCILSGRKDFVKALTKKDSMLGWNGIGKSQHLAYICTRSNQYIDICCKIRLTESEIASLGPKYQKEYERDFVPYPTRPVLLCGVVNAFLADQSLVSPGQYITMGTYTAYPYSRGSIHITSPTDVLTGYDFDAGFLNHPSDLKTQVWAYKISREIARRLPYYKGELELGHPKFPEGSKAALQDAEGRYSEAEAGQIENLEYSEEDDRAIEEWIRGNLNTTWHSLGTCAMKPLEQGGIVDGDLNVYGTIGLKVGDLSMVPENVGANTNNTALVVGEKAATIIGRELGIEV